VPNMLSRRVLDVKIGRDVPPKILSLNQNLHVPIPTQLSRREV
jgi:hypothetical protein